MFEAPPSQEPKLEKALRLALIGNRTQRELLRECRHAFSLICNSKDLETAQRNCHHNAEQTARSERRQQTPRQGRVAMVYAWTKKQYYLGLKDGKVAMESVDDLKVDDCPQDYIDYVLKIDTRDPWIRSTLRQLLFLEAMLKHEFRGDKCSCGEMLNAESPWLSFIFHLAGTSIDDSDDVKRFMESFGVNVQP